MTPRQQGFTLIELAIVMLLLTILAAGVLVPLTKRIEIQRYEQTQKILEEAKEALIGYAMSHRDAVTNTRPYLPCPDIDGNGTEDRVSLPGPCSGPEGNFPWATLGVASADAWGNRLRYRVTTDTTNTTTTDLANSANGFSSTTKIDGTYQSRICTPPTCTYTDSAGTAGVPVIAAIIVSHGPNGWGALNSNGTNQASPPPANVDEIENTNANTTFVSRSPSAASSTTTEFDDVVVSLPTALLVSRVCPAGGCP